MEEYINQLSVSSVISVGSFSISLIGVWLLSLLCGWHYTRFFPHISRSQSVFQTIFVISTITFLIISVVKSSLALSLGLVGALSIIRFRTPIKEPFELAYLFISISIGLGFGATQAAPTIVAVLFVLFVLSVYSKYRKTNGDGSYFLYITTSEDTIKDQLDVKLAEIAHQSEVPLDLRRADFNGDIVELTILANTQNPNDVSKLLKAVNVSLSPESLTVVDNQKLMPF